MKWNETFLPTNNLNHETAAECSIILKSKVHQIWPKSAQNGAQNFFSPKEPYFWKKEHNFHPKTIFFYTFIHKFFWKCQNVAIFFGFYRWFLVFFKKFSKKVYFTVLQRSTNFFKEPLDSESRTNVLQSAHHWTLWLLSSMFL